MFWRKHRKPIGWKEDKDGGILIHTKRQKIKILKQGSQVYTKGVTHLIPAPNEFCKTCRGDRIPAREVYFCESCKYSHFTCSQNKEEKNPTLRRTMEIPEEFIKRLQEKGQDLSNAISAGETAHHHLRNVPDVPDGRTPSQDSSGEIQLLPSGSASSNLLHRMFQDNPRPRNSRTLIPSATSTPISKRLPALIFNVSQDSSPSSSPQTIQSMKKDPECTSVGDPQPDPMQSFGGILAEFLERQERQRREDMERMERLRREDFDRQERIRKEESERQERQMERQERIRREDRDLQMGYMKHLTQIQSQESKRMDTFMEESEQRKGRASQVILCQFSAKVQVPNSLLYQESPASEIQWNRWNKMGAMVATLSGHSA